MMQPLSAGRTLSLWERGEALHALDRAALLCATARPDLPPQAIADLPLGTVTESLLELRVATFGAHLAGHTDCARCGQRLGFELDLAPLLSPSLEAPSAVEVGGRLLRAPSLRDLAAVASDTDTERAAHRLLARCMLEDDREALDDEALAGAETALEALDPHADIVLALHCPACGDAVQAQLDAGSLLWDEIEAHARALLREVDLLARAYGWTEAEILGLGAVRRANYVAMASA